MDFTKLAVADTGSLHLKDAAGNFLYSDGKPCRITFYGPGTLVYAEIENRQTNRALKRREDNDGKPAVASPEQRLIDQAEDLATLTVGFENIEYEGKAGLDLYLAFYGDQKLGFIVNQVTKFLSDWGNFKPGSAGN